mmetsp:Transcript_84460/g.264073  ORF Transcript_84460/g.264073 Transcript_84460/m.264073 type:complete len:108 (+) Transcript_84460:1957-2280(+)
MGAAQAPPGLLAVAAGCERPCRAFFGGERLRVAECRCGGLAAALAAAPPTATRCRCGLAFGLALARAPGPVRLSPRAGGGDACLAAVGALGSFGIDNAGRKRLPSLR